LATDLSYALADNYPNRFNPTTKINNQVLGYKVTTLVNEQTWAGICTQKWNAVNRSSEVNYFDYKLKVLLKTEKIVLIKESLQNSTSLYHYTR
jgi:hypothetical protein